jgi:Flp pilus assembly protein TadD
VIEGRPDEAIKELQAALGEFRTASALDPKLAEGSSDKFAELHVGLGLILRDNGQRDEAIKVFRQAIELDHKHVPAHHHLGNALLDKGLPTEAAEELRAAVALNPKNVAAHIDLGLALHNLDQFQDAIREYRKALELDPKNSRAHNNIGWSLRTLGQLPEAIQEYRTALELDPDNATARNNLRQAERLVELDRKLPAILEAKEKPADDAERLELARLCLEPFKGLYAASFRLYAEAFAHDAKLTANMQQLHRYNAACAAALAGCGQGKDADQLDDKERARLRQQALAWLKADLAHWTQQMDSDKPQERTTVQQQMKHWQADADFTGVRDKDALAKLPAEECAAWQQLWADVAAVLKRTEDKK